MKILTLAQASLIVDAALAEGARRGLAPLCIVVLDAGGHVLALKRDERASLYRSAIATAKANGCLGMGMGGREIVKRSQAMPAFYAALAAQVPGGLPPSRGGVLIRDANGAIVGAAGASGDTGDNDEACVVAGILAASLSADPGES